MTTGVNQTRKQDQVSQKQIPSVQIRAKTPIHSKPAASLIPQCKTNANNIRPKQNNYQPLQRVLRTSIEQRKKAQRKVSHLVNGCRNVGYSRNGGCIVAMNSEITKPLIGSVHKRRPITIIGTSVVITR